MNSLLEKIDRTIRARGLFSPGQKILAAVSGGLDSMALLYLLHELSQTHGLQITVAHFNHQLRARSSDADERLVKKTATDLKVKFVGGRADVKQFAKKNRLSIEMAGRKLRHEFLARTAKKLGIKTIALAHHADDQVELFFLRLFRGAGTEGLAGMNWKSVSPVDSDLELVRPLLDQPKEVLRVYAKEKQIYFREDASNDSLDFQRNRIRHELIPLLKKDYQPALEQTIFRAMEILREESRLAKLTALDWLGKKKKPDFSKLPIAVQRCCLRLQLLSLKLPHEFNLIESLRSKPGELFNVNTNRSVFRDARGWIIPKMLLAKKVAQKQKVKSFKLSGEKGETDFNGLRIQWSICPKHGDRIRAKTNCEVFDAERIGPAISLRNWKPGDRFQPIGMKTPVKLQNLFTNLKIPRGERHQRVVAVTGRGEIFWVEGLRISERFKLDKQSTRRFKWEWWHRLVGVQALPCSRALPRQAKA